MAAREIMKFEELVEYCKNSVPAPSHKPNRQNIDYICESIYICLNNETQYRTIFIVCNMFPFLKVVGRRLLLMYMKSCDPETLGLGV